MPAIIDVWMQHPTLRFMQHDMFASLRKWTKAELPKEELPLDLTLAAMDDAGVDLGLICAWYGPEISGHTPIRSSAPCRSGSSAR